MKTNLTIAVAALLMLASGSAYADQLPNPNRDLGIVLYESAFVPHDIAVAAKADVIGVKELEAFPGSGAIPELGTALYHDFLMKDTMMAGSDVTGSAAGGMREDENTRIWDKLLEAPVGTIE